MGVWDFPNTVQKNRFVGTTLLKKLINFREVYSYVSGVVNWCVVRVITA
jgi:hypothetical protein